MPFGVCAVCRFSSWRWLRGSCRFPVLVNCGYSVVNPFDRFVAMNHHLLVRFALVLFNGSRKKVLQLEELVFEQFAPLPLIDNASN